MGKRKSADGEGKATAPGEEPEAGSTASRRREERKAFKKAKRAAGKAAARAERQAAAGGGGGAGLKGGKRKKGGAAEGQDESERREREALALALETGEVELCVEGPGAVEGKVVGDALVLIDKSTGRVFSSQQRGPADEFVCVGTWDSSSSSITPLSRQQRPPASQAEAALPTAPTHIEHAFQASGDDHCETSPQAHADIAPLLTLLANRLGKAPADLRIYDPYFCAGGTVRNLSALGFTHVINRNEDFYVAITDGTVPEHDVVVTNPPYSEDHVARALKFCAYNLAAHGRPWLMLLPNYVYAKDYFRPALQEGAREGVEARAAGVKASISAAGCSAADAANTFYLAPRKRYYYWTPKALVKDSARARLGDDPHVSGQKKKRTHRGPLGERTSPFLSFWYCGVGAHEGGVLSRPDAILKDNTCMLAKTPKQLPSILQAM